MSMLDKLRGHLPEPCFDGKTIWIDGEWRAARQGSTFTNVSPIDGSRLFDVARGQEEDVDAAVAPAKATAPAWHAIGGAARARILRALAMAIRNAAASLGLAETIDAGRPIALTGASGPQRAADLVEFYAGLADKISGRVYDMPAGQSASMVREPYGVIAAITPWNYPLSNALTKLAPILACGNTVVLKPAEQTPLVTMILPELLRKAGMPDGVVNVVTGLGQEAGVALVSHPDVELISFTGSTETGRRIAALAGEHLKGVVLELGGKSPFVVFDDADIDRAADAAVFTTFMNQGQTCTSCSRIIVQRNVLDDFLARCRAKLAKVRFGDPLDPMTQVGPVVSKQQMDRITRLTDGIVPVPLDLDCFRPTDGGYFVKPLIAVDFDPESAFARSEIFGPAMSIRTFDDDAEAFRLANDTEYGLAGSCWTSSLARAEMAKSSIQAGVIWINCVHVLTPAVPVSGHKSSGIGIEYGIDAVEQYMRVKSVVTLASGWTSPFA